MPGWKKKVEEIRRCKPVLNRDLLEALDQALTGRDYEFIWVKGHSPRANETADSWRMVPRGACQEAVNPPGFGASADLRLRSLWLLAPIVNAHAELPS